MAPSRRALLSTVGGAAAGGLAWRGLLAAPGRLGSPPGESDCPAPAGADGPDRVVCSAVESQTVRFALGGQVRHDGADGADVRFRFRNTLPRVLSWNPYRWLVWKRRDGRWFRVYPRAINQPLARLPPGATGNWRLQTDLGADVGAGTAYGVNLSRRDGASLGGLGGGEYAVSTTVSTGSTDVRLAARFDLSTPAVSLVPPGEAAGNRYGPTRATELVADGDPRVVREPDAEEPRELVVERTDADHDRWLGPEQAVRRWPLRDALAWFEPDVERVVVQADTGTAPPFGIHGTPVVRYDGSRYRVVPPDPDR